MKKFFSLIAILAMLSIPVMAQDSDPVDVQIQATLLSGCTLTITPTTANWAGIPIPTTIPEMGEFIPMDELVPIQIIFTGRFPDNGTKGELTLTTTSFQKDGVDSTATSLVKFSFTEGIDSWFPAQDVLAPSLGNTVSLWTTDIVGPTFFGDTTLVMYFANISVAGSYTGTFTFQVMEVI